MLSFGLYAFQGEHWPLEFTVWHVYSMLISLRENLSVSLGDRVREILKKQYDSSVIILTLSRIKSISIFMGKYIQYTFLFLTSFDIFVYWLADFYITNPISMPFFFFFLDVTCFHIRVGIILITKNINTIKEGWFHRSKIHTGKVCIHPYHLFIPLEHVHFSASFD